MWCRYRVRSRPGSDRPAPTQDRPSTPAEKERVSDHRGTRGRGVGRRDPPLPEGSIVRRAPMLENPATPARDPCTSSNSATIRAYVPSARIAYKSVRLFCRTENALYRPSEEIAGPPKI